MKKCKCEHWQTCAEKQSAIDVWEGRYADLSAKCAELEAEVLSKEGMALVTKEDAENYCRILSLLGMEEEGSPIEGVEHLISLRDGMTCGDCNDTGWLENREEGRYPCTCMTEAEPYQILEAERDALTTEYHAVRKQLHKDLCKSVAERDALKAAIDGWRSCAHQIQSECDALKADYQQCCGLVANMHLAAMGCVIGPVRGVVEDVQDMRKERDALAITVKQMREALESLTHVEYALDLPLLQLRAMEALSLPDNTEAIIKRHDAEVLRKAAEHLEGYEYVFNAPPINYAEAHELRLMANELEKSCQP